MNEPELNYESEPTPTIESLQYRVEYLLDQVAKNEYANKQQELLIQQLQEQLKDKQLIIDLQNKLIN